MATIKNSEYYVTHGRIVPGYRIIGSSVHEKQASVSPSPPNDDLQPFSSVVQCLHAIHSTYIPINGVSDHITIMNLTYVFICLVKSQKTFKELYVFIICQ